MNSSPILRDLQMHSKESKKERSESRAGRAFEARIPSLDGLRAISIAFVLFSHFGADVYFRSATLLGATLISLGLFGVKIFFVISGYLITLLLLQEQARTGRIDLFHFYVRRSFRILPAAYAYMAFCFLIFAARLDLVNKILAILFLENYSTHSQWLLGHLWSLGVEEQFYLLWPALFIFFPRCRIRILLFVLVVVPFINVAIIHFRWPYWSMAFYSVADSLACGCLLALIRKGSFIDRIVEGGLFLLIPLSLPFAITLSSMPGHLVFGLVKSLIVRPWLNVAIALSLEKAVRSAPMILNTRWLTRIGVMSYSIYLWQQPVTDSTLSASHGLFNFAFRFLLIALLASCSFYIVELPFLGLRRRLFRG